MKDKIKRIAWICFSGIAIFISVLTYLCLVPTHVLADSSSDQEIMRKTLLNALRTCYSDSYMVSEISGPTYNYGDISSLFTKSGKDDQIIKIPSAKVGNSFNSFPKSITCEEVFIGAQQKVSLLKKEPAMTGIVDLYNLSNHPDLTLLGYYEDKSTVGEKGCVQVFAKKSINGKDTPDEIASNKICFSLDKDDNIIYEDGIEEPIPLPEGDASCPKINVNYLAGVIQIGCGFTDYGNYVTFENAEFDTVVAELQTIADGMENWYNPTTGGKVGLSGGRVDGHKESGESFSNYIKSAKAITEVLTHLTGVGPNSALFTWDDVYYLWEQYYQYLKSANIISESNPCQVSPDIAKTDTYPYVHYDEGKGEYCGVRIVGEPLQYQFNVVYSDNMMELTTISTEKLLELITEHNLNSGNTMASYCEGLAWARVAELTAIYDEEYAKWQKDHTYDLSYAAKVSQTINKIKTMIAKGELVSDDGRSCVGLPNPEGGVDDPVSGDLDPEPVGGEAQENDTPACYESASSLGWILCPVLEMMANVSQSAYENVKDDFLEMDAETYSSTSPAHEAWKNIRNWGNLVFVILLLIVIFSQVTGIGLDNYSIKKVLPRLIMVVVLTNLSFIICQLAIDLSNILGDQVYKFLEGINVGSTSGTYDLGTFISNLISTLFTTATIGAGVFVAAVTWDKWLIPLLLFFLVTVVGVLFFGILLAVRKAAVIILAIFSPVAIVCYALPNTKKVYDRWFKMFSAMLLLYPICGALMGGGSFASKLLLTVSAKTSTGFLFQLVAMLVQIVPFFFVPTLVRSSFTALGNLGNRIANFGNRLGGTAAGIIRGAEATKDLQRRMNATEAARRARRYATNKDLRGRLGTWMNNRGLNGDGLLSSNGRIRAQSRAISLSNSEFAETERAKANTERGLTVDDENRAANIRENLRLQQQEEEIKAYADRYKTSGMATNDKDMQREYDNALDRLIANSDDADAMAQLVAAQRVLAKSDGGRTALQNSLYGASSRLGGVHSSGLERAANRLLDESGADIKARNRGFFKYLTDVGNGEIAQGTFSEAINPNNGKAYMGSDFYDAQGDEKWSPGALTGADATSLIRLNERIAADNGIEGSALANLASSAAEALNNENITKDMQPEVRRELAKMAGSYYIENSRSASNASNVNLTDAMRMGAARPTDLSSLANEIRRNSYDNTSKNRLASVAERALLEANNGNLSLAAGNADLLRDIMVAAGRSTAAVDQGSSINVPHNGGNPGIILPGQPGYNSQTVLGNQGGQGPHIAN